MMMMNNPKTLNDSLLTSIDLGNGLKFPVNLAFDNVIRFFSFIKPDRLTERRLIAAFFLLVPEAAKSDAKPSTRQILQGLNSLLEYINYTPYAQNEEQEDITGQALQQSASNMRYYDFEEDSMAIYASFKQAYGIDLWDERGQLHWTKFQALLLALPDDCLFKRIVEIRQSEPTPPNGNDADSMRAYTRQLMLKRQYALHLTMKERLMAFKNQTEGME